MPIIEIVSPAGYYSNFQKRQEKSEVYRKCPADLTELEQKKLSKLSMKAMEVLSLHDLCRMDVRLDFQGNYFILEVNPLPSLFPDLEETSYVCSAAAAGYSYTKMLVKTFGHASANTTPGYNHEFNRLENPPEDLISY